MAVLSTAMVLSAGYGRRMRPLSTTTPKPLIEVAGKALIDHCLDGLAAAGIEKAVVNVHYMADLVEAHLGRRRAPKTVVSDERAKLLDTGGGCLKALPLLGEGPFLLRNCDSFWLEGVRPNLDWLISGWNDEEMDGLLLLASTVASAGYWGTGDFMLGKDGRLTRRAERTVAPFAYAGAAILSPRLFRDPPGEVFSLNALFDRALEEGRLFGVQLDGLWINVENPDAVKAAEMAILESAA
ncbi:MurNAc alpha-1-phosphate uridylyltransferase [Rhodopseudomonas julia]|uniref:MurNAc alpha-1-phosphate uridylyltransferase n=2 Tax=Rhodopseudomonas julia TaxID=200617 RepID=A0ABU0C8F4_9BRAD|nr:MurNAc alpha-1-phosphate uridylyltransferase [Rhodopseudomonas julia]